ncbi:MAG TPA: hypothetical protein V6C57_09030 [Coleofasciculaceae cyanobacterium]
MKTILSYSLGLVVLTAIAALAYHAMAIQQSYPVISPVISIEGGNPVRNVASISVQQSAQQSDSTQSGSFSQQQTTLNLNAANLKQPYILSVSTAGAQLNGQIVLDGKVIQVLSSDRAQINLSPYLTVGQHTVEISADYAPASSSIRVEFSGVGTSISQQTSGSGRLRHILLIQVD